MADIEKNEIIISDSKQVMCEGNRQASGHPRVYLKMDDSGKVTCPYCSRIFQLKSQD
ncbi:MAG: zinc-finger domain-containing protein [Alphaproteobacteria bacterium]|nr:zinc-finger domain-containing protein [Alphaproteobacteria bacterium]